MVRTTFGVALLAGAAALGHLAFGAEAGWAIFASGMLALLAYHARNLNRLLNWLPRADSVDAPGASGLWDDAFASLHRRERRHAEERQRMRRLLVQYAQAGRALPDGAIILDGQNRILWCNEKAEARFGIDRRGDAGQLITNLVRQPEFVEYLSGADYTKPIRVHTSRGAGLTLSIQIIPYDDEQKLLLARDVTQAERLETMRRDFIANVSHELRTPLTVLTGFCETLRELKLDAQRSHDYLDMMTDQSRRMQRLLDDLLTLSALESSPEPPSDERIVMSLLLARVKSDAEILSDGRHHVELKASGDWDLLGSEAEIASAFGNLVSNAVRYTPAGGEVRIAWRAGTEGAEFVVEDTGIGIAPEHIPRLTERFYRIDRSRSRETGGTGLGLAIVKHALERHQASLAIDSDPGKGSRFTARFPARRLVRVSARQDLRA